MNYRFDPTAGAAMNGPLDKRLDAFRPDLADARLQGHVEAERFVEGRPGRIVQPVAPVRRRPAGDATLDTEALFGEAVAVFETDDEGWSWVQLMTDGYVGYVPSAAIAPDPPSRENGTGEPPARNAANSRAPSHKVVAPRTLVFPGPDIKLPPLHDLPMGALVTKNGEGADHNARYAMLASGGAVVEQHLAALDTVVPDFVAVAERFLGVPYLWGGKTALGIDCSGLVQMACRMAGIDAPRDTDMQERGLGTRIAGIEALERGDLVFWKGHLGIMLDGARLLHANAFHMMTAIEPVSEAIERIAAKGVPVTSVRRIGQLSASA